MSKLLTRLTYASTATFKGNINGGIESEVARILLQSRRNNSKAKLGGVLHYGEGYFFQCLEGPRDQVNETYKRIGLDERHSDIQILTSHNVEKRMFKNWSMKYLPLEENLNRILKQNGQKKFNPYIFDNNMIEELLKACVTSIDPIADLGQEGSNKKDNAQTSWWKRFWSKK
jgi:hypothetical protein